MSRAFAPGEKAAKPAANRVVQRRCASCASKMSGGSCAECEKKKRGLPVQFKLQLSTPGDASEREAERAADDVMRGQRPLLHPLSPGSLAQRQEAGSDAVAPAAPEMPSPAPAPSPEGDGGSGADGSTSVAPQPAPICNPTGFARADYLTQPGTSTGDFGLTRLDVLSVTMPSVTTTRARGGVRIDPTTAALPTIPSVFTAAGTFTEGQAHFLDQDGTSGCASGRYPLRWTIDGPGANKIRDGEQEHCADFHLAFDLSLRRFADATNALATAGTVFANQSRAERAVARRVGVAPANWSTVFVCLAQKSLLRDTRNLHLPHPMTRSPRPETGCAFLRAVINASSLPQVGRVSSASLIRDCGEAGSPAGSGRSRAAPRGAGTTPKPEISVVYPEPAVEEQDPMEMVQRDAMDATQAPQSTRDLVGPAMEGPAQPLDRATGRFMESRFGYDFSRVRVHTGEAAAASAAALHAHAYTVGRDVVFNRGAYAPDTEHGRHLLAHELAHVVQQGQGASKVQREDKETEHEDRDSSPHEALNSPGRPLDTTTRGFMEARFGRDFGQVRVHDDTLAARSASALDALAYTAGHDIVFGRGAYAPMTPTGRRILAHELAHVAQSPATQDGVPTLGAADSPREAEADRAADAVLGSSPTAPSRLTRDTQPVIRRWKITGNTAVSDAPDDTLGRLAEAAGAHFDDWKCIKPVSVRTSTLKTRPSNFDKRYELYVQNGDTFDISNLTATTGETVRLHLFSDSSQKLDADLAKLFYSGSTSSLGADEDMELKSGSGSTPISDLVIFGHSGGNQMWGDASSFTPSTGQPEEPVQTFTLAEAGLFPRRCWFTRNAKVRLVGCNSDAVGTDFARHYLREGAEATTTTRSVRPKCSTALLDSTTGTCTAYDGVDFASSPSPRATSLDGPFWSASSFHGGKFWKTIKGEIK